MSRHKLSISLRNRVTRVREILKAILIPDGIYRLAQCDALFFCHDVDRGISLDGKAYSPLLDSVRQELEQCGLKCQTVAHPFSLLTGEKAHFSPVSINKIYTFYRLIRKFLPLALRYKIFERFNPYKTILRITGARLMFTIGAPEELCHEARHANCFHVEVLHGLGYKFLPWGWGVRPQSNLPQGILSLDKISTQSFRPLTRLGIETKTIPHPFLKRFIPSYQCDIPKEWMLNPMSTSGYKKEILVSLSWGYSGDHGEHTQFANILNNGLFYDEIADIVSASREVFWRFRFHPVQLRDSRYKRLFTYMEKFVNDNSNSEWRISSTLPLVCILKNCSGHLSMASMSCYEAATVGVPSLMLCPNIQRGGMHEDWFADLADEGYVTKAPFSKNIVSQWVTEVKRLSPRLTNLEDNQAWEEALNWVLFSGGFKS